MHQPRAFLITWLLGDFTGMNLYKRSVFVQIEFRAFCTSEFIQLLQEVYCTVAVIYENNWINIIVFTKMAHAIIQLALHFVNNPFTFPRPKMQCILNMDCNKSFIYAWTIAMRSYRWFNFQWARVWVNDGWDCICTHTFILLFLDTAIFLFVSIHWYWQCKWFNSIFVLYTNEFKFTFMSIQKWLYNFIFHCVCIKYIIKPWFLYAFIHIFTFPIPIAY